MACSKVAFLQTAGANNRDGVLEDTFWSPLVLASKVKSLALRPPFSWIVEILKIAWKKFLESVFYWRTPEKNFWRFNFFLRSPEKNFWKLFFFWRTLSLVSLASSIFVLGLERVCPRKGCPWPRIFFCVLGLGLEPCVLDSTSGK